MLDRERDKTPLSLYERESIVADVLNELFGLGPLEILLADPTISDILVNRFDQVYIERNGRLEPTDDHVQGRTAPACRSSNASSARSAGASTSRARWSTPGSPTDRV